MTQDYELQKTIRKNLQLAEERNNILSLPAEKALDSIFKSKQPATLIQSFPSEDLYFLMHDIGPEDFLPVLSLATSEQWGFILDMEIWQKDRINSPMVTTWMDLLFKADPDRFLRWMIIHNIEFFDLYLFKNIEIRVRDHDQEASDIGDEYMTIDDVHYIKFIDYPFDLKSSDDLASRKEELITKMLAHLATMDYQVYQGLLLEVMSVLPAETEEEVFRLRNVRLAEKGFLPFHEAAAIYQPLDPEELKRRSSKMFSVVRGPEDVIPVSSFSSSMLEEEDTFKKALAVIDDDHILWEIQGEFAALCNLIISADQLLIREKEQLRGVVKKACRYVSIGLEIASGDQREKEGLNLALVKTHALSDLFKTGYGRAVKVKWKADRWLKDSWFKKSGLPLTFWGETWYGVLGGLFLNKPLYFSNYEAGLLYRDFETLSEIQSTEEILEHVIGIDALLSLMTIDLAPFKDRFVTCQNLLLTTWAIHGIQIQEEDRLPNLEEFRPFFRELFENGEGAGRQERSEDPLTMHRIRSSAKRSFLTWLAEETGLEDHRISSVMAETLETIFSDLENEYGAVAPESLDPELISLFCITS